MYWLAHLWKRCRRRCFGATVAYIVFFGLMRCRFFWVVKPIKHNTLLNHAHHPCLRQAARPELCAAYFIHKSDPTSRQAHQTNIYVRIDTDKTRMPMLVRWLLSASFKYHTMFSVQKMLQKNQRTHNKQRPSERAIVGRFCVSIWQQITSFTITVSR